MMRADTISRVSSSGPDPAVAASGVRGDVRLPNFLIIGAARSGTTTLHYVLGQHPQIYMSPNKETNFFAVYCSGGKVPPCTRVEDIASVDGHSVRSIDDYRVLFRGVSDETAIGETSPSYLLTAGVPQVIRSFIPQAKLVAVLRQPIDKAYSHFLRKCQTGIYSYGADFAAALEQDEARIDREGRGTSFLGHGRYCDQLKRFYDSFDSQQIKICLFEDMETGPEEFYADLLRYLGVDANFRVDTSTKFNQSGRPKVGTLARLTHISKPLKNHLRRHLPPRMVTRISRWRHSVQSASIEKPPALSPALRQALTERYFGEEIKGLEKLIGRDLSHWLK